MPDIPNCYSTWQDKNSSTMNLPPKWVKGEDTAFKSFHRIIELEGDILAVRSNPILNVGINCQKYTHFFLHKIPLSWARSAWPWSSLTLASKKLNLKWGLVYICSRLLRQKKVMLVTIKPDQEEDTKHLFTVKCLHSIFRELKLGALKMWNFMAVWRRIFLI